MTLLSLLRLEAVKTWKHVPKAAMFFYVISAIFRWAKVISEIDYHFQSTNQFAER